MLAQLIAYELEAEDRLAEREAHLHVLEDFISIATHDLRQPLTALSFRAQLLQRRIHQHQADGLSKIIDDLVSDVHRTLRLSELLLDTARIESGNFTMDTSRFDLAERAREIARDVSSAAVDHQIEIDAPVSLPIIADAQRIEQVLRNILDNAVKYVPSDAGPISLRIWSDSCGSVSQVYIQIQDRGEGVTEDELDLLFDRQFRAASAIKRGKTGSGIGLYIARKIVEAHGGSVVAQHTPGGGLTVELNLPDLTNTT
ncbi:MAG: sensor histidine kinase [Sphaerobacteraceae bacterium]|nr:MAG: sensor histidine kinase [Sphaerobacteraceae bacterium]